MARSAEAGRLADPIGGRFQPEPEMSFEIGSVRLGPLRVMTDGTPPSRPWEDHVLPKELGGYGPRLAEAMRSACGRREDFQPEPEFHAASRPCPVKPGGLSGTNPPFLSEERGRGL